MAQNICKARKVFQSQNLLGDDLLEDDNDLTACSLLFQILTNPSRFFEGGLLLFPQLSFYGANKRVPSLVVGLEMKNEFRTAWWIYNCTGIWMFPSAQALGLFANEVRHVV